MQRYYEIVRARVREGHEAAMLELRPRFVRAMKARFPGLLDAHLVRLDDGSWLDIVSFASPEDARAVAEGHAAVPEAVEMGQHIESLVEIVHGSAVDHLVAAA